MNDTAQSVTALRGHHRTLRPCGDMNWKHIVGIGSTCVNSKHKQVSFSRIATFGLRSEKQELFRFEDVTVNSQDIMLESLIGNNKKSGATEVYMIHCSY